MADRRPGSGPGALIRPLLVLQWSRRGERVSLPGASLINPAAHPSIDSNHQLNDGLHWAQMRSFAQQLGLREMPLATPSPQEFERWFREYGPVWTDGVPVDGNGQVVGTGHVVVLAGKSLVHGLRVGEDLCHIGVQDDDV